MDDRRIADIYGKIRSVFIKEDISLPIGIGILLSIAFESMLELREGDRDLVKTDVDKFISAFVRYPSDPRAYDTNDSGDEHV